MPRKTTLYYDLRPDEAPAEGVIHDAFYLPDKGWYFMGVMDLATAEILEPLTHAEAEARGADDLDRLFSDEVRSRLAAGGAALVVARPDAAGRPGPERPERGHHQPRTAEETRARRESLPARAVCAPGREKSAPGPACARPVMSTGHHFVCDLTHRIPRWTVQPIELACLRVIASRLGRRSNLTRPTRGLLRALRALAVISAAHGILATSEWLREIRVTLTEPEALRAAQRHGLVATRHFKLNDAAPDIRERCVLFTKLAERWAACGVMQVALFRANLTEFYLTVTAYKWLTKQEQLDQTLEDAEDVLHSKSGVRVTRLQRKPCPERRWGGHWETYTTEAAWREHLARRLKSLKISLSEFVR